MIIVLMCLQAVFGLVSFVTKPADMALLHGVPVPVVPAEVLHVLDDHPTHQALESFWSFQDWQPSYTGMIIYFRKKLFTFLTYIVYLTEYMQIDNFQNTFLFTERFFIPCVIDI